MNLKQFYTGKAIGFVIVVAIALAYCRMEIAVFDYPFSIYGDLPPDTSAPIVIDKTAVDPALLTRLQADLQEHHAVLRRQQKLRRQTSLTPQEDKIKNDIVDILVSKEANNGNGDYYSQMWPVAVGKRYILIMQPTRTYYDILIDSQTGESSYLQNAASYVVSPPAI